MMQNNIPPGKARYWMKKYASQIGFASLVVGIISLGITIYSCGPHNTPEKGGIIYPEPTPVPTPEQKSSPVQPRKSRPRLQPTEQPTSVLQQPPHRIIEQPRVRDIIFTSSSTIHSRGGYLAATVVKIQNAGQYTAVTFKIDGSMNDQTDLGINCPSPQDTLGIRTNIIDNHGQRSRLVNSNASFPGSIKCTQAFQGYDFYRLEAHETIYITALFEPIDSTASSLDINFSVLPNMGELLPPIHVVM